VAEPNVGIPFVKVIRKSDIEASSLVMIYKLVTWFVLLFKSVRRYLLLLVQSLSLNY